MLNRKLWSLLSLLLILALVLVACGSNEPAETPEETTGETTVEEPAATPVVEEPTAEEPMAEVDFPVMPGGALEQALKGDLAGTVVTVDGPFADADIVRFDKSMKPFEDATGIDVQYIGGKEFEASISVRVDAGDAPDIADFPQPGLMAGFVRQGKTIDPSSYISADWLKQQYNQSWLDMGTVDGVMGGVWHRFNGKSLVWYPKAQFDAAGYQVPETWDDLQALMDTIVDDGDTPWCIGIESGVATGWAATDWTEEMMLRTTSLDNYDAWVTGELPFDSPEVRNAIESWSDIWFNDDYVFGGRASIVTTNFGDAPLPMFEDPPQCWLHKQGNFITSFFPDGVEFGTDYGVFYFPPKDEAYGKPFLVAGDIMTQFNDRPEVRALMEYFTVPESAGGWLSDGGALAVHQTTTPDMYGQELERNLAELVANATSFRFDGSDLMPGEVGAGTFWTGMTDYVSGAADLDTVLPEIDASWPSGVEGQSSATEEEPAMAEGPFPFVSGGFLEQALNGDFDGTVVTVDGPFADADIVRFDKSMKPFEDATGIDVQYIGGKEFEASISVRVDAGDAPDIADFPQPGLMAGFVRQGKTIDPTSFIPMDWLQQQYNQSWLDMGTVDGVMGGVWHRFNGKSLVWYPKAQFEAAGYEIPTTWDDLMALTQTIADDGDTAWCIGIESGVATGWAATDWTEEMMLRTTSLDNYDAWVTGELPFDSPEVRNAIESWSDIWFNDDYVFGGRASIVTTNFGDAPLPMFEDPPKCWLHKQGNFITSFFPDGTEFGKDYGVFYLPPKDEQYGKPFLVAGDIMTMFNDRPEVRALMEYFTVPESAGGWLSDGGALAVHQTTTPDMYGQELERNLAELVANASSFRFDGSDLMPGEVGAGTFWTGMTDYVSGAADLDTVLPEIDASWPQ